MAGLTKSRSDDLPFPNLTKDPATLPIWRGYSTNSPMVVSGNSAYAQAGATWTTAWQYYGGDAVTSNTTSAYVTVVNLTNLTYPIVVGAMIGRYSNSSVDHKFKITVDGVEHIIDTINFDGRLCVGSLYNSIQSTTNGAVGRTYPYGPQGLSNAHYGRYWNDTVEQPIHQYQAGMPMLYAERSFKFEDYVSGVLTFNDYNNAYVQYHQLGIL